MRNFAIITGGDGSFDFDSHGDLMYVTDNSAVLEWCCGCCHACAPRLPLLLKFTHKHFIDATREYSSDPWAAAEDCRQELLATLDSPAFYKTLPKPEDWEYSEYVDDAVTAPAAGYYANELHIGRGATAYSWLLKTIPNRRWRLRFLNLVPILKAKVAGLSSLATVSQSKVLSNNEPNYPS